MGKFNGRFNGKVQWEYNGRFNGWSIER